MGLEIDWQREGQLEERKNLCMGGPEAADLFKVHEVAH
jgi:hypothetical protein